MFILAFISLKYELTGAVELNLNMYKRDSTKKRDFQVVISELRQHLITIKQNGILEVKIELTGLFIENVICFDKETRC